MKSAIELFSELGERLSNFGADDPTRRIIAEACRANDWFRSEDICRAVKAIAGTMLRRDLLEAWLAPYPVPVSKAQRVLVVMAGNIPLVGFFDLLCVLTSGHRCVVKPSAKDTVLIEYIVEQLQEIEPEIPVAFYDGIEPVDAVIATGSDNANRYFRARYAGLPALLRGSRQSVAVLSGKETAGQLAGLFDDIWAYSGLGCRNVSLVFLPVGYDLAVTMPAVHEKYRNNYLQTRALLAMTGQPFRDLGTAVAVEERAFPDALSKICLTHYRELEEVEAWLAEHDQQLQCVVSECIRHSRRAGFGCSQSPALTDYPDDRDVLAFLAELDG